MILEDIPKQSVKMTPNRITVLITSILLYQVDSIHMSGVVCAMYVYVDFIIPIDRLTRYVWSMYAM